MKRTPLSRGTSQLKRAPLARGTKKLSARAKTHTNPWWRKQAVAIAKLIAKYRDNYTCVTCGRTADSGYQMHGSHILPESKFLRESCNPENIMCQCARCHMNWHENPIDSAIWFDREFPKRYNDLAIEAYNLSCETIKPDYEKITKSLKEQYKALIN
jgi:hypothetical protein